MTWKGDVERGVFPLGHAGSLHTGGFSMIVQIPKPNL